MARNFSSGDYLEAASDAAFDIVAGSLSFWFKIQSGQTTGNGLSLFSRADSGGGNNGISTYVYGATSGAAGVGVLIRSTGTVFSRDDGTAVIDSAWHHFGLTWDQTPSAGNEKLYLDGTSVYSSPTGVAWAFNGQVLRLGKALDTYWANFVGDMAELAIWDVQLGDSDFATLAGGVDADTVDPTNLVDYWKILGTSSPEPSTESARSLTVNGTTQSAHPFGGGAEGNRRRRALLCG